MPMLHPINRSKSDVKIINLSQECLQVHLSNYLDRSWSEIILKTAKRFHTGVDSHLRYQSSASLWLTSIRIGPRCDVVISRCMYSHKIDRGRPLRF